MRIPVDIHQTNKKFCVTVQQNNARKLEFADHLWLLFLDQPQSRVNPSVTNRSRIYVDIRQQSKATSPVVVLKYYDPLVATSTPLFYI